MLDKNRCSPLDELLNQLLMKFKRSGFSEDVFRKAVKRFIQKFPLVRNPLKVVAEKWFGGVTRDGVGEVSKAGVFGS